MHGKTRALGRLLCKDRVAGTRVRLAIQDAADPLPGRDDLAEIDSRLDAEPVEQVQHILGRDVTGGALGVRAAAEACDAGIEGGDAQLQAGVDIYVKPIRDLNLC